MEKTEIISQLKKVIEKQMEKEIKNSDEDIDIDSIELKVMPDCKFLRKKYILDDLPDTICLGAIIRDSKIIIPNQKTNIKENDQLLIFLKPEYISKVENIFQ